MNNISKIASDWLDANYGDRWSPNEYDSLVELLHRNAGVVGNCVNCGAVDVLFFAGRNLARTVEKFVASAPNRELSLALESYRNVDPDPLRVIPDEQLEAWANKSCERGPLEIMETKK